ncbi:monocarboxylate transporter 7 [Ixodes scapularis]
MLSVQGSQKFRREPTAKMDSARSWLVAAGCCWISVFTFSMIRSAAILYVGILDTFHVTREEASWPISVTGSVYFMTALVGGILARYIKIWKLTLAGCLICSSAVSVCYFATSIWYLAVFLGFIHGAGVGLLSLTTVVINQHFVKYRAVASGLNMAGFSIGGLLFPPLTQFFLAEYGLRPMFLLCGAVILNAAAGAILQRIPPCSDRASAARQQCGQAEEKPPVIMLAGDEENLLLKQLSLLDSSKDCRSQNEDPELAATSSETELKHVEDGFKKHAIATTDDLKEINDRRVSNYEHGSLSQKPVRPDDVPREFVESQRERSLLSFCAKPKFYVLICAQITIFLNMSIFITVITDYGADRGIAIWDAVSLISSYTIVDLLARLGTGWVTDHGYCSRNAWMALNFLLWALAYLLIPIWSSYIGQVFLSGLAGWSNGCTLPLVPVLFMDVADMDQYSVSVGIGSFVVGLAGLTRPAFIGYYRDTIGNYDGLFFLLGTVTLGVSVLWTCTAVLEQWSASRRNVKKATQALKVPERGEL